MATFLGNGDWLAEKKLIYKFSEKLWKQVILKDKSQKIAKILQILQLFFIKTTKIWL